MGQHPERTQIVSLRLWDSQLRDSLEENHSGYLWKSGMILHLSFSDPTHY